ncbi:MAG: hypothetical protein R6W83_02860 [Cryobacterium sp.]
MPDADEQTGPPAPRRPSAPDARTPRDSFGHAAVISAFLALAGALIPFVNYIAALLALAAITLGIVAIVRSGHPRRRALTGITVGVIALILSIVLAVIYTAGIMRVVDDERDRTSQSGSTAPSRSW